MASWLAPVPSPLRWLVYPIVAAAGGILIRVSVPPPDGFDLGRVFFWIIVTLVAAALPVRLPGGEVRATITTGPLLAALFDSAMPNPFGACWVAFIGTFELRDLRGDPKWFGTLFNKSMFVISTFVAWLVLDASDPLIHKDDPFSVIAQVVAVGAAFAIVNNGLTMVATSRITHAPLSRVWAMSVSKIAIGLISQVPLGWLMAEVADKVGQWAAILFMVPLLLARYSFSKYTETRDLFYGTVSALSQAIDAKDGFTRGHADRVSRIAGALARELGLSERDIETIELAGLLHDIGKIGIEDRILMKPARLETDEQELMRRHPIYGASILEPSAALRPLVPIVLHHHESFDGSGYPEGLRGEDIPIGSRILLVADTYEAMTSDRIYRKAPGHDRAIEQLNKYKGSQFDPKIVRALEACIQRRGQTSFEASDLPPINYETLAELRRRLAREPAVRDAHAS